MTQLGPLIVGWVERSDTHQWAIHTGTEVMGFAGAQPILQMGRLSSRECMG